MTLMKTINRLLVHLVAADVKRRIQPWPASLFIALSCLLPASLPAAEAMTVAVFNFESTDEGMRDLGPKAATLINATLSAEPDIITVERAELEKALGEMELGLSGTVAPDTAAKVGH